MFSRAEQELIDCMSVNSALANKELAEKLFVTEKTVKFHLTNIYKKMNAKNRIDFLNKYSARFGGKSLGAKMSNSDYDDYEPQTEIVKSSLPTKQGFRQLQAPQKSQEDKISFVNDTFKVTETLTHLHKMMTEVTNKEITPATVGAACNCVARLNETVNTAIQAARFLNER